MANNRLELHGMAELQAALRLIPANLAHDGAEFVDDATEHTAASLIQSYPTGPPQRKTEGQAAHVPGALRRGVKWTVTRSQFGVVGVVRSTSPHAHLWEYGTAVRSTRQGWNRGRSPSHHRDGLIPIAVRNRKTMNGQLVGLVRQAGFQVSGVL